MNNKDIQHRYNASESGRPFLPDETLRRELQRMRTVQKNTIAERENRSGSGLFAMSGVVLLLGLGFMFYQFWPSPPPAFAESGQTHNSETSAPDGIKPKAEGSAVVAPVSPQLNPKPKEEAGKTASQPFTAVTDASPAFKPNPFMEELAGNMKSGNVVVTPQAPAPDAVYASQDCAVQIPFEGTVSGSRENLNLSVYSNQTENYKQDKPLFEEPLLLEKTGVNHKYALKAMLKLRPGLYYFVIENKKEETVAVGKFKVG